MQSSGYIECKSFWVLYFKFEIELFKVLRLNLLNIIYFSNNSIQKNKFKNYTCKLEL